MTKSEPGVSNTEGEGRPIFRSKGPHVVDVALQGRMRELFNRAHIEGTHSYLKKSLITLESVI